ncbi:MAG TPA: hypothetical protein VGG16_19620, partial [Streptosporangiaceae bacterium]
VPAGVRTNAPARVVAAIPPRYGLASLVISKDGQARIEVWKPGDQPKPYSVRQNLQPLVLDGKPTGASYDWGGGAPLTST